MQFMGLYSCGLVLFGFLGASGWIMLWDRRVVERIE
jgi:hypothetical protein